MAVGLVIVSHSAQLARGITELAQQMVQGAVAIVPAGGTEGNVLGTSVDIIQQAIQSVDGPDGVLVLLDLGSATLSTEMALELLSNEQRQHIKLSVAPLVEGAINAAIEASTGHSLDDVKRAAEQTASVSQLGKLKGLTQESETSEQATQDMQIADRQTSTSITTQPAPVEPSGQDVHELQVRLTNPTGLHARPASLFVREAARFQANIEVLARGKLAEARSVISLLSLGTRNGDTITLRASGIDAQSALEALKALIQANFYETGQVPPETAATATSVTSVTSATIAPSSSIPSTQQPRQVSEAASSYTVPDTLHGISTSPGVALGPVFLYTTSTPSLTTIQKNTISADEVANEQQQLQKAVEATIQELQTLAQQLQGRVASSEVAILDAQILILRDPMLLTATSNTIAEQHIDAVSALAEAAEYYAIQLERVDDALVAGRAADIRDVASRAIRHLRNEARSTTTTSSLMSQVQQPVILVARDLTPSHTSQLRPDNILGICTVQGGPTSHTAILARALGIPAIAGLDEMILQRIRNGDELGMDANVGILYLHPNSEIRNTLTQRQAEQQKQYAARKAEAQYTQTPLLIDNQRIALFANVGSETEAQVARQWGAEGIGLLRTEFLFANAQTLPQEEEQRQRYAQVFQAFRGANARRPIIVRTLDAGADKPIPALQQLMGTVSEPNPALGVRGIRIHLAHQELLAQQLTALLLAAADTHIELHIMFPMITTVEELRTIRTIFEQVYNDVKLRYDDIPAHIPLGIMVEVPAAAIMAPELATLADFFSIGANDLLQYTLASDRTNAALSKLYNPMQPSVLRLIRQIAEAGYKEGKLVAVCGEIASNVQLAPVLVGLGIQELSMAPNAIPAVRSALEGHSMQELRELADSVYHMSTLEEVEKILGDFQGKG